MEYDMRRFTEGGRLAINSHNWYAALSLALMIPDICGSLEEPSTSNVGKRYRKWCDSWLVTQYKIVNGGRETILLSAQDCYQLRCSLIHSGSDIINPRKRDTIERVKFVDPTNGSHLAKMDGVLHLRADRFSEEMYAAAEKWDDSKLEDEEVQSEKERLLTIYSGTVTTGEMRIS
jgi:hypothetical protein